MERTKYSGVYVNSKGQFYYGVELGTDKVTGKRIRKRCRKDKEGNLFNNAADAYKALRKLKRDKQIEDFRDRILFHALQIKFIYNELNICKTQQSLFTYGELDIDERLCKLVIIIQRMDYLQAEADRHLRKIKLIQAQIEVLG